MEGAGVPSSTVSSRADREPVRGERPDRPEQQRRIVRRGSAPPAAVLVFPAAAARARVVPPHPRADRWCRARLPLAALHRLLAARRWHENRQGATGARQGVLAARRWCDHRQAPLCVLLGLRARRRWLAGRHAPCADYPHLRVTLAKGLEQLTAAIPPGADQLHGGLRRSLFADETLELPVQRELGDRVLPQLHFGLAPPQFDPLPGSAARARRTGAGATKTRPGFLTSCATGTSPGSPSCAGLSVVARLPRLFSFPRLLCRRARRWPSLFRLTAPRGSGCRTGGSGPGLPRPPSILRASLPWPARWRRRPGRW